MQTTLQESRACQKLLSNVTKSLRNNVILCKSLSMMQQEPRIEIRVMCIDFVLPYSCTVKSDIMSDVGHSSIR